MVCHAKKQNLVGLTLLSFLYVILPGKGKCERVATVLKEKQGEINSPLITEHIETCVFTLHELKL